MGLIHLRGFYLSCLTPLLQIAGTAHAQESEAGKLETITVAARKVSHGFSRYSLPCRCCEVHRGTLFGRNTIGGAILLTTTEPGDDTATAKLSWEPVESLRASLNLDYTRSDENGTPLVFSAITESLRASAGVFRAGHLRVLKREPARAGVVGSASADLLCAATAHDPLTV